MEETGREGVEETGREGIEETWRGGFEETGRRILFPSRRCSSYSPTSSPWNYPFASILCKNFLLLFFLVLAPDLYVKVCSVIINTTSFNNY
jgi:hypothetical protein